MKLIILINVLELNQLLPKLLVTNFKETNNFGIKLQLFVLHLIMNMLMLQHQEDKNFNLLVNLKPLLKEDSLKLLMKVLKLKLTSEEIEIFKYFCFFVKVIATIIKKNKVPIKFI